VFARVGESFRRDEVGSRLDRGDRCRSASS
jgi:hypothetical protein